MDIIYKVLEFIERNTESIGANLLSSAIWFTFGVIVTVLVSRLIRCLRYAKYQRIFGKSGALTVLTGDRTHVTKDDTVVRATDFRAAAEMSAFLERTYPIAKRTIKDTAGIGDLSEIHNKDLILIGGPNNNPGAKHVIEALRTQGQLIADFQGYSIRAIKGGAIWAAAFDSSNQVCEDYGFAYGFPNPFNRQYRVLLLAGCKGVGTIGVVKWIMSGELASRIPLTLQKQESFCFLIKCHADAGTLVGAHCVDEL